MLVVMYARLAHRDEAEALARFGRAYAEYAARTPRWLPRLARGASRVAALAAAWLAASLVAGTPGGAEREPADPGLLGQVAALGRLEPERGVFHLAGPPRPAVVIESLEVEEGDRVAHGQVVAVLQGIALEQAELDRVRAELAQAEREVKRRSRLRRGEAASDVALEEARLRQAVARADLARAEAQLELSRVRAPIDGQVLEIHAREGERVGTDGILELGATDSMVAVAEVYETDIGRVRLGQRARIRSPALPRELTGSVERIGLRIGKQDVLSTDPVADIDARVVEVEVRLDDPAPAARLTNLRVDVRFEP